jgi:hypothetical protein
MIADRGACLNHAERLRHFGTSGDAVVFETGSENA